jgi:hypothetical protein
MELCILVPGISSQHHGTGSPEQVSNSIICLLLHLIILLYILVHHHCFSYFKKNAR